MMPLLLLALAALQEPSPIPDLLRALDDDSIEARIDAAEKLVALRESATEPLRKLRQSTKSVELGLRIDRLLARIELEKCYRDYRGGKQVARLGATLRQRKSEPGGPLLLEFEIVNLDKVERPLIGIDSWITCLPGDTQGTSAAEAEIRVTRLDAGPPPSRSVCVDCVKEPPRTPEPLGSGKSRVFAVPLGREILGKGHFELQALYFSRTLLGTGEDLASNILRLEIRE